MKAIIIGATGATGNKLLDILLEDKEFDKIEIFARRDISKSSDKLNVNIIDFDKSQDWKNLVKGDVLFSCLGTTLKDAGSKKAQWKIDYDYQYEFAKAAKENGIKNYVLISSGFASVKSPFYYAKMKGQLEVDIIKLDFEKTIIFNPPPLERENSQRTAEVIGIRIIKFLNSLGLLKSQKPLRTEKLAQAMVNSMKKLNNGIHSIGKHEIINYYNE